MYALRAPRRCQRRPRPLYSRAPAAPACFRSIARAETSPRSASPSVSVSVPPAATSRSVVRCLGSFAPDLSPSPASCSDPGVCDRMDDARTREPALRCVSGTPRGTRGEQGICARAHAGSGGARSTNLGKRPPYHWSRNGGGHLPAHHASMFCLFRGPSSLPLRPRSIGRSTCRGCSRCSLVSRLRARKDMPQLS